MSYNRISRDIGSDLSIRLARADDDRARATAVRLAALDSATVPAPPYLIAAVEGRAIALHSLADGATVADPFVRTADVLPMLELRAAQLRQSSSRVAGAVGRLRRVGLRAT